MSDGDNHVKISRPLYMVLCVCVGGGLIRMWDSMNHMFMQEVRRRENKTKDKNANNIVRRKKRQFVQKGFFFRWYSSFYILLCDYTKSE